MMAMR